MFITEQEICQLAQSVQEHFGYLVVGSDYPLKQGELLDLQTAGGDVVIAVVGSSTRAEYVDQLKFANTREPGWFNEHSFYYRAKAE